MPPVARPIVAAVAEPANTEPAAVAVPVAAAPVTTAPPAAQITAPAPSAILSPTLIIIPP